MNLFLVRRFVLSRPISEARLKTPPPFFFLLTFSSFFFRRQPDQLSGTRTRGGGEGGARGARNGFSPTFYSPISAMWFVRYVLDEKMGRKEKKLKKKINLFPPLSPCLLACWCLSGCRVERTWCILEKPPNSYRQLCESHTRRVFHGWEEQAFSGWLMLIQEAYDLADVNRYVDRKKRPGRRMVWVSSLLGAVRLASLPPPLQTGLSYVQDAIKLLTGSL